jgi:hypothetical protein
LRPGVLIDELGGVCLLGLLDRIMGHTADHIRYTLKGIVVDDRLDDRARTSRHPQWVLQGCGLHS